MAWFLLLIAGLLEVVWAYTMKLSQGFTRTGATIATLIACFVQTLSGHTRTFAQSIVDRHRNAANGVLH